MRGRRTRLVLLGAILAAGGIWPLTATPASAATVFVACHEGDSLQSAINNASAGSTLVVTGHCDEAFYIRKSLTLIGGWARPTIGPGLGNGAPGNVSAGSVVLENLLIEGNDNYGPGGGGLDVTGGSVVARNVEIRGGRAKYYYGHGHGGGVTVAADAAVTFENSSIHNNFAKSDGGGIYSLGALTLRHTSVLNNDAYRRGGGIFSAGNTLVADSVVQGNDGQMYGGGIRNDGTLHVLRSTIASNATRYAGGALSNAGDLIVEQSSLLDNEASSTNPNVTASVGGALSNGPGAIAEITTSTIGGNAATSGGALWNDDAVMRLKASTVADNSAIGTSGASGIGSIGGLLTAESTVLSGNAGSDCVETRALSGGGNYLDASCAPTNLASGDHAGAEPLLGPAADNGGPTHTMRPSAGSPVVDKGRCIGLVDQRKVGKPQGAGCEVGAYENRPPSTPSAPALSESASPNRGTFTLTVPTSSDPDGDGLRYSLEARDADDPAWKQIAQPSAPRAELTNFPGGTWRFRLVVSDGNNTATSAASAPVVVDRDSPGAPSITANRAAEYRDDDGHSWYADTVTVSVTPGGDPANPDGSPGSGTVKPDAAKFVYDTAGAHTTSDRSVDAVGNTSALSSLTVYVDDSVPEVSFSGCPEQVLLGSAVDVDWAASDTGSGLSSPASGTSKLDASQVGTQKATITATDNVGHNASAICTYAVVYDFAGFFAPLHAAHPALNKVTAGGTVPVRFSLHGDHGLSILSSPPAVTPISCTTLEPLGDPSAAAAQRPLSYDTAKDVYTFWWATQRTWRKTCVQLAVSLDDGTTHLVNIGFH